ncbi:MAG: serine protease, partial [Acidobacteria bacterium]
MPAGAQLGVDASVPQPPPGTPQPGPLLDLDDVPRYRLPPVNLWRLERDDEERAARGLPAQYAAPIPVAITPWSHGAWERLANGRRLWRLRIASPGALSLNLGFSRFSLPAGARLYLYDPAGEHEIGPFTQRDNDLHGQLWTPPLPSDELVLELTVPAVRQHRVVLELGVVNHGYAGFGAPRAKSGDCNVDVGCGIASSWAREARSVGLLSIGGVRFCTGFLVNNTAEDGRPLLLTARHCGIDEGNAASVVVLWRHAFDGCRLTAAAAADAGRICAQDDDQRLFQTGAIWRAEDPVTDLTLIELDDPPEPAFDVYYAGWDRSDAEPRRSVVIHHPNTDAKRVSFDLQPATTTSYLSDRGPGNASHLRIGGWELGTTEGGSSGAPLFNQDRRVVGVLHGGHAACGNHAPDWFGRLSAAWDGGSRPQWRLRDWLDPLGTGALALDGLDPR